MNSAMESNQQQDGIPTVEGASYCIIDGNEHSIAHPGAGSCSQTARHITFFNAQGDQIKRITQQELHPRKNFFNASKAIDLNAPKPKIATYGIKWWNAVPLGNFGYKGAPGPFIVLRDKNGNHIESYRYNDKTKKATLAFQNSGNIEAEINEIPGFDMSNAVEKDSDNIGECREKMVQQNFKQVSGWCPIQ